MLSAFYLANTHFKISLSSRCTFLVPVHCENVLRLSCYLPSSVEWILAVRENFSKNLVIINVGNEKKCGKWSLCGLSHGRGHWGQVWEGCVQEQGGNDLELAHGGWDTWAAARARRQRAGLLGEEHSKRATLHSCQLRSDFLGVENSIWKVSHRKQKELQCVKAIWPHHLMPINHWGCLGGSGNTTVPGGSERVLGQHDIHPAPSMWNTRNLGAAISVLGYLRNWSAFKLRPFSWMWNF